ncbi:aspartic peptidase domain-containing protein [Suillus subalutaceus]|uniref:aspartic peptidase domain-containing protein n=1 Tax=Suillus subalutaceus TaxID=48586 RepID=UPI001B85B57C|nr:aspartic peptidase domain-containing protein [Suillus subalutaceus]KAG1842530.1 aspartic peptidase domain-containing protein [Suillus subalutaceus]
MVPSRSLSSLLALPALAFLSLSASALPHARTASSTAALKLAVRINSYGMKSIVAADRARIETLQARGSSSVDITNTSVAYTADIGVGSPATSYTFLVDTGSSNTWIGTTKAYQKTSTSHDTGGTFKVAYGNMKKPSSASGEQYLDTVTVNSNLVIYNQSIGVASSDAGLGDLDGVLGLGPVDLTEGTVSNADEVPTVMDNLYKQKKISSEVLGVFFAPASSDDASGELTFGGYDDSKFTGDISYAPITSSSPANTYWGFNQSITYGSTVIMNKTAGVLYDIETLLIHCSDALSLYQSATGATLDLSIDMFKITSDQYDLLKSLYFTIGGVTFELTPNAQIWPRSLNSVIGGTSDSIYLVIGDTGKSSGSGLDFVSGYCFLERFYSVYDTTNSRIGVDQRSNTLHQAVSAPSSNGEMKAWCASSIFAPISISHSYLNHGLGSRKAVYDIAATNCPDMIDPAMVRPGRLDKLLYVDLPSADERVEILRTLVRKVPFAPTESGAETILQGAESIVREKCDDYSGASLAAVMDDSGGVLVENQPRVVLVLEDFVQAQDKVGPSVSAVQRGKYEALRAKFTGLPV